MIGWKYTVHTDIPTMIGWTIDSKVHGISTSRKVTHPSTIQLRWLNLGVPMDLGKILDWSHPRGCGEIVLSTLVQDMIVDCKQYLSPKSTFMLDAGANDLCATSSRVWPAGWGGPERVFLGCYQVAPYGILLWFTFFGSISMEKAKEMLTTTSTTLYPIKL